MVLTIFLTINDETFPIFTQNFLYDIITDKARKVEVVESNHHGKYS